MPNKDTKTKQLRGIHAPKSHWLVFSFWIFSIHVSLAWVLHPENLTQPVIWLSPCKTHSWDVDRIQPMFPFLFMSLSSLYKFPLLHFLTCPEMNSPILNSHWELFKMAQFFLAHNKSAAPFYQNHDIMTLGSS